MEQNTVYFWSKKSKNNQPKSEIAYIKMPFHEIITQLSGGPLGDDSQNQQPMKQAGGNVIVQDEETSVVWGMPGSVVREGAADKVVPIDELASEILKRAWKYRKRHSKIESGNGEASSQ
mgnify:CR=1 FL=1